MPAADLLALIVPATPGQATAPGLALGVGKAGAGKPGEGLFADVAGADGQDAGAVDSFSQALAALMAAPGLAAPQAAAAQSPPQGQEPSGDPAETPDKGLQTALAATAKAGAPAHGLTKLIADAPPVDATGTDADAEMTSAQVETSTPDQAKTLPETAKADEALARRLSSPPPRSERAQAVANGLHLPPWAPVEAPPTPAQSATPVPTPAAEIVEVAAVAETASGEEPPVAQALAAAETAVPTASKPAAPPRAEGRALGKAQDKDGGAGEDAASGDHHAQGVGRGLATAPGQLKKAEGQTVSTEAPPPDAPLAQTDKADAQVDGTSLALTDPARAGAPAPAHGDPDRVAPHTVAHLAEQIVSKSEGKATRFDVQLDPAGLGKVDVKIEIGRGGEISAAMSFDNPAAASEMRARAGELRSALEQAGFDLSKGGLSFDFSGQNPGRNLWDQPSEPPRPSWARGAFTDLAALADTPSQARWRQVDADSVDVTV